MDDSPEVDNWVTEAESAPRNIYQEVLEDLMEAMTPDWTASGVRTWIDIQLREKNKEISDGN